jgi:hypothetical protein
LASSARDPTSPPCSDLPHSERLAGPCTVQSLSPSDWPPI